MSDKIQTFNVALGQFNNEKIKFELSENNYGDHRVKSNSAEKNYYYEDKIKIIDVGMKRLDTIIQDCNPKETLLWIDVQGYEGFVLEGGINTIRKKPPLVIEFEPYLIERLESYNLLKKNLVNVEYKNCYNLNSKYFFEDYKTDLDNLYDDLHKTVCVTNLLFFD